MAQTYLVTGGGRGIGRGICIELAKKGYSVLINFAGNEKTAEETKTLCEQAASSPTQQFSLIKADISDPLQREALLKASFSLHGRLDGLVNNAGIAPKQRFDFLDMPQESYDRLMDVNLKGPIFLTQLIANEWKRQGALSGKTVIFISSISSDTVSTNRGEYCISKAGLSMGASLFATSLAPYGAHVFEVRPGIIKTDMTSAVESKYDALIASGLVPQLRWGTSEDVGKTVAALASGVLPYSTGAVIHVDGGQHIPRL
ncbi:MAG TPA: 3-ketoacyl-ACP reductase [Sphaerochaeta sp.]|nr:3-ketoacyl-ACP reductase [Sphaerochaeta sp.]